MHKQVKTSKKLLKTYFNQQTVHVAPHLLVKLYNTKLPPLHHKSFSTKNGNSQFQILFVVPMIRLLLPEVVLKHPDKADVKRTHVYFLGTSSLSPIV